MYFLSDRDAVWIKKGIILVIYSENYNLTTQKKL